jgi:hypothetical protein
MAYSQVQICNLALLKFGSPKITAITDNTPEADACEALWDVVRDEVLYEGPWNFAMRRADLGTPVVTAPAFEYDYAYTLPTGCIRVWDFYNKPVGTPWEVEGGQLLTNETEEIYIRYIYQATTVAEFSVGFSLCLATKLAAELAIKIGSNIAIRQALAQEYKVLLSKYLALNALEGDPQRKANDGLLEDAAATWVTSR